MSLGGSILSPIFPDMFLVKDGAKTFPEEFWHGGQQTNFLGKARDRTEDPGMEFWEKKRENKKNK